MVFKDKKLSLSELVQILKNNIHDKKWHVYMRNLDKFGNDIDEVDHWTVYVVDTFVEILSSMGKNTRGGKYLPGLYSVTNHELFGSRTGALPHGRRKGEPFSSGIAPGNGMDKKGPTALLNSLNRIDFSKIANGINFNMKFNLVNFSDKKSKEMLQSLTGVYFDRGGMQTQINVLDPSVLIKARDNPDSHPNLMVRISGYCAYFNDLNPQMKEEIISRSYLGF
jgi:formate C-acetyltransferase